MNVIQCSLFSCIAWDTGDHIIERHAVCAAANLMEMSELNSRLIEERGVAPLVALASNDDPNSRGEACRCLANLSVNPDVHQVIIICIYFLISYDPAMCREFAVTYPKVVVKQYRCV